jgi:hypothetical protein
MKRVLNDFGRACALIVLTIMIRYILPEVTGEIVTWYDAAILACVGFIAVSFAELISLILDGPL